MYKYCIFFKKNNEYINYMKRNYLFNNKPYFLLEKNTKGLYYTHT